MNRRAEIMPESRQGNLFCAAGAADIGVLFQHQSGKTLLSDADSSCQAVWSCTYYDRIIFVAIRHCPSLSLALDGWMRQGQEGDTATRRHGDTATRRMGEW